MLVLCTMRLLIVYDEVEHETLDDAELIANLIQRTFNNVGRKLGIDAVDIEIVQEDDLA